VLRAEGLEPKKAFGQNFLVDRSVVAQIAAIAAVRPDDVVVEIGGGLGILTGEFARATEGGGALVVVEKDRDMVALLTERYAAPHVRFVRKDALYVDFAEVLADLLRDGRRAKLVANLPYNISSEMVFRLLDQRALFSEFDVMLQREVAERLAAAPGSKTYGVISVLVQLHCDVELTLKVRPGAFYPEPKVHSRFVRFTVLDAPRVDVGDERHFTAVVKAAFSLRRKTLANALKARFGDARPALEAAGIDPQRRAETLSITEFAALAGALVRP